MKALAADPRTARPHRRGVYRRTGPAEASAIWRSCAVSLAQPISASARCTIVVMYGLGATTGDDESIAAWQRGRRRRASATSRGPGGRARHGGRFRGTWSTSCWRGLRYGCVIRSAAHEQSASVSSSSQASTVLIIDPPPRPCGVYRGLAGIIGSPGLDGGPSHPAQRRGLPHRCAQRRRVKIAWLARSRAPTTDGWSKNRHESNGRRMATVPMAWQIPGRDDACALTPTVAQEVYECRAYTVNGSTIRLQVGDICASNAEYSSVPTTQICRWAAGCPRHYSAWPTGSRRGPQAFADASGRGGGHVWREEGELITALATDGTAATTFADDQLRRIKNLRRGYEEDWERHPPAADPICPATLCS